MGSINRKVETLLDSLFDDRLISGLQVVQRGTWITSSEAVFDARTGEVTAEKTESEVTLILLPFQGGFQDLMSSGNRLPTSTEQVATASGELKFVMKPLEKEAVEALEDEFHFGSKRYQVTAVQPVWLGEKVVLWEVVVR